MMRSLQFALAALLGLTAISALAQSPTPLEPITGARPGHVPGVGESLPKSNRASNIVAGDTKFDVAPTLPSPAIGAGANPSDYLRAARVALVAGRTGEAQQSLEMAETRSLDRSTPAGQGSSASDSHLVSQIRDARRALGSGDSAGAIAMIDRALAG
jgi:hypothetical protein